MHLDAKGSLRPDASIVQELSGCTIAITIVQSYTGKYHEFVAVHIAMSVQHE